MDAATWADNAWCAGLRPEPALTVSEWADRYRQLASRDSAEPGPWRTERTPYLRQIMNDLSPSSPVERVVIMAGAQIGKTSAGLNWLGYIVDVAPGPVIAVQPTVEMAKRFSKQRLNGLFEETPRLRGKVADPRSRDSGNTMLQKDFAGGTLVLTGANSPTGLMSMPARYLFLDEVDQYPADAEGAGDPIDLAIRRAETFVRRKVLMTSTPTLAGFSRIETAYEDGDRRRYYVPCPCCGTFAPIEWARIRWPDGEPELAHLVCDDCGGIAQHRDKPALLAAGEWRPTAPGDGRTASYHLSALYSPWRSWGDVAAEHGRVHKDPARLQVWVNATLAETWEDQAGEVIPSDPLLARREDWGDAAPEAVRVLTAGVDLQADRIEVQVVGWGADEESWVVDYRTIDGDPSGPRIWADLDVLLSGTYKHANGGQLPIMAAAIDTGGHHTKGAYDFCRARLARRIWGIKGAAGPGIPVWPRRASRVDGKAGKLTLFRVGVDAAKDALFARLRLSEPGPGYVHFGPKCDVEYLRQLTSERVVTSFVKGRPVRSWQCRKGERNEALNTYVYAMAALHGLIAASLRLNDLQPPDPQGKPRTPVPKVIPSRWLQDRYGPRGDWFGDDKDYWRR
jgi:phage terminase large subunit GpA-like protein